MGAVGDVISAFLEAQAFAVDEQRGIALVEFEVAGRRSVCVFEVAGGLIRREREYVDDRAWRGG